MIFIVIMIKLIMTWHDDNDIENDNDNDSNDNIDILTSVITIANTIKK